MDFAIWWGPVVLVGAGVYFCGLCLWTWLVLVAVAEDEHRADRTGDLWDDEPGDDEPPGDDERPGGDSDCGGNVLSYRDHRMDRMPRGRMPRDVSRSRHLRMR